MRKGQGRHALRKCAEIRALQVVAAEAEAARAEARLLKEKQELAQRQGELENALQQWQRAVSQPVLKLDVVPIWRTVVVGHEEKFEDARGAAKRATSLRDAANMGVHVARQRSDIAEQMAARAAARHRDDMEETALHEAADRHLHGSGT